jgi:hypothetical protein
MQSLNIEAALIAWLGVRCEVPVSADVPAKRPPAFITVERTGGPRENVVVDRPAIAIQCWAETRDKALQLAYSIDAILLGFTGVAGVNKVIRGSLYNFPDGKNPRYQIVVDFVTTR